MMNPLTALPAKVRLYVYVAATLVLLGLGAWQASDGNWLTFAGLVAGALVHGTAASNVSKAPKGGAHLERGAADLALALLVAIAIGVAILLFHGRLA